MAPLTTNAKVPALDELLDGTLDQIIRDFAKDGGIPGVSLTIHCHASAEGPGETVFRSYGIAHGDETITPKFPLCSISKTFVSLALLRLLHEHGYNEDTLVRNILPEFRLSNETDDKARVTWAHVLSHTTGLETDSGFWAEITARGVSLYDYLAAAPCANPPGVKFCYSNILYDLCVPAIEALAGSSVDDYLELIFFKPLDMWSTSFKAEGAGDAAEGHIRGDVGSGEPKGKAPAPGVVAFGAKAGFEAVKSPIAWKGSVGLVSCGEDMAKWLAYLPTDPYYSLASKPRTPSYDPVRPGNSILDIGEQYGLGLFAGTFHGVPDTEHWAGIAGFSGLLTTLPSLGLSVASMSNSWEAREMGNLIVGVIVSRVLGLDVGPVIRAMTEERIARITKDSADFEAVVGVEPSSSSHILGTYFGPGIGRLTFMDADNVKVRPRCADLPWLCWMYGDIRPIVAYLGEGQYAACLEFKEWGGDGSPAGAVKYGFPFRFEKVGNGDKLEVSQVYLGPPFVLHRE